MIRTVKIEYECPECGEVIVIEKKGHHDWGEGFQHKQECPTCHDKVEISYMLEPVD